MFDGKNASPLNEAKRRPGKPSRLQSSAPPRRTLNAQRSTLNWEPGTLNREPPSSFPTFPLTRPTNLRSRKQGAVSPQAEQTGTRETEVIMKVEPPSNAGMLLHGEFKNGLEAEWGTARPPQGLSQDSFPGDGPSPRPCLHPCRCWRARQSLVYPGRFWPQWNVNNTARQSRSRRREIVDRRSGENAAWRFRSQAESNLNDCSAKRRGSLPCVLCVLCVSVVRSGAKTILDRNEPQRHREHRGKVSTTKHADHAEGERKLRPSDLEESAHQERVLDDDGVGHRQVLIGQAAAATPSPLIVLDSSLLAPQVAAPGRHP